MRNLSDANNPKEMVLVVDDEAFVRDLLVRWLAEAGYNCAQAKDADEAWSHLRSHDVDLVTCDVRMPRCSGTDLLREVKRTMPDVAFVMLTGAGEARTAIAALTSGACGYLLKPVEREELLFHVARALEHRQLIVDKRQYTEGLELKVQEQTVALRHAHEETIHRLVTATMCRDEETGAHIRRTGLFSEVLALAAGWSPREAEQIRMAAPMHDVGKIGIPDVILRKPGKLTAEEYDFMKQHTVIGARMLEGSTSAVLQMAQSIALNHHERWDGTGYPSGKTMDTVPECARIVAIVDVYDALSHDRVYRPALPRDEVLKLMQQGQSTQFDPFLLTCFFTIVEELESIATQNPDSPPCHGKHDPTQILQELCKSG